MDASGYNWPYQRSWKTIKNQGKVSIKSGNFDKDIKS